MLSTFVSSQCAVAFAEQRQVEATGGASITAVLPTGQAIHPTGFSIAFEGRPTAVAIRPDGRTAAVLKTMGHFMPSKSPIMIVDLKSKRVLAESCFAAESDASFTGLVYSLDGSRLFASDPNGSLLMARVVADGTLRDCGKIALPVKDPVRGAGFLHPEGSNTGYPGGIAMAQSGRYLYVAMNMNNSVAVIDLERNIVVGEIAVGKAPYAIVVDGDVAYVTNQGGRVATSTDRTALSAGTKIVADPVTARPASGTVSVVDLKLRKVASTIEVGIEPTAMTLYRGNLFVCNTNSDTVTVIDTTSRRVIKTISMQPFANAPFGSSPNAIMMLPTGLLVVSLGANNALAIYDWKGPTESVAQLGLLPTAWYPSAIAYNKVHGGLVVTALKGAGIAPMEHVSNTEEYGRTVLHFTGILSLIPVPRRNTIAGLTRTVIADNCWDRRDAAEQSVRPTIPEKAIPERIGEPSPIKHVIYIIKENHKYDEDLGDDPRGNGSPANVEFGKAVTPNQHAIVSQFPLLDNFYVSGTVSIDGHQWANSAFADDYIERGFGGQFKRGYPFNGGDNLAYTPSGYIWENAIRHGKSVQVFGEYAAHFDGPKRDVSWTEWFQDSKTLEGNSGSAPRVALGEFQAKSDVPSLDALLYRNFPGFDGGIPDQYRADMFLREFNRHVAYKDLPSLTIMTLPDDHGAEETSAFPTIRSAVADNDLAFGRVVEAISHSPYWKDSVIISVEDDASYGVDHVDGHRSPVYVISPYARRGIVDHTYYTQIDVVRTIEQILGLPPMNQRDLVAAPMSTAFTESADLTPFAAVPNQVPLDEMNPAQSASRLRQAWIQESTKLFASRPPRPDAGDENLTARAVWYSSFDFKRPFPGDRRVLYPFEVPRSKK